MVEASEGEMVRGFSGINDEVIDNQPEVMNRKNTAEFVLAEPDEVAQLTERNPWWIDNNLCIVVCH